MWGSWGSFNTETCTKMFRKTVQWDQLAARFALVDWNATQFHRLSFLHAAWNHQRGPKALWNNGEGKQRPLLYNTGCLKWKKSVSVRELIEKGFNKWRCSLYWPLEGALKRCFLPWNLSFLFQMWSCDKICIQYLEKVFIPPLFHLLLCHDWKLISMLQANAK